MYKIQRCCLILFTIFSGVIYADNFDGTYLGESDGVAKLIIKNNSVHGYGSCTPGLCDWGNAIKTHYSIDGKFLTAEFQPIGEKRQKLYHIIVISHTHNKNKISVSTVNYWNNESSVTSNNMNTLTQQEFLTLAK